MIRTVEEICKSMLFITLEELAYELRKIFKFKYLIVENIRYENDLTVWIYECLPVFEADKGLWYSDHGHDVGFFVSDLVKHLDLSEYKDESGKIDFSKCIVEVK